MRHGCLLLPLLFSSFISGQCNEVRKEIKDIQDGKEEIQLFLSTDNIIVYMEILKESAKNLLELISEFSLAIAYKESTYNA